MVSARRFNIAMLSGNHCIFKITIVPPDILEFMPLIADNLICGSQLVQPHYMMIFTSNCCVDKSNESKMGI